MESNGREAVRGAVKVVAATALFAGVHSLLASRASKRIVRRALGTSRRNALYRPLYLVQSVATFGALLVYFNRQPARTLYEVHGPLAWSMRAGQVVGLGHAIWGAYHVGIPGILGLSGLTAWIRGKPVTAEPEAQGPVCEKGEMKASGPFRWHRHPLNFAPLPVLWLFPRMTTRLGALNLASTVYLIAGSLHEEARLRAAYPSAYPKYEASGVPFYLPGANPPVPKKTTRG